MRIAFLAEPGEPLRAGALEEVPLGGSESALLLAARELARRGHAVTLACKGAPDGTEWEGVRLRDLRAAARELPGVDAIVTLNRLIDRSELERLAPRRPLYVHWHQNDAFSAYGERLGDPALGAHVDLFVFVSHTQAAAFLAARALEPRRAAVIANPVSPPFRGLFPDDAPVLAAKDPDLLVYASAPNRGLVPLLRGVLPRLRASRASLRLEVFSGFQLDQGLGYRARDGAPRTDFYAALLGECEATPGVTLRRGIPKPRLAEAFRVAAMLCYPCTYRETCCVAALEAMAAGCQVSTTDVGALPETTGGFAGLTHAPPQPPYDQLCADFAENTLRMLAERARDPEALERRLRRQIDYVLRNHDPAVVGAQWERLLARAA